MGLVCGPALTGRKPRVAGSEESETCMCREESYWGMTPVFRNVLLADNTAVSSLSKRVCYQRGDLSVSTITQRKARGVWSRQRTVASISCCRQCLVVSDTSKHFQLESKLLQWIHMWVVYKWMTSLSARHWAGGATMTLRSDCLGKKTEYLCIDWLLVITFHRLKS